MISDSEYILSYIFFSVFFKLRVCHSVGIIENVHFRGWEDHWRMLLIELN